jgi:hypothetical protein
MNDRDLILNSGRDHRLWVTKFPIQCVLGHRRGADHTLHVVQRLRVSGVLPPVPHASSSSGA